LGKKESDFSSEIWKVGLKLTTIMDRMKEELNQKDNLRMRKCLKALAKAQGQLLKAFSSFDSSFKISPDAVESWEHFLAKNYLLRKIPSQRISPEFGLGGCIFDVVAKLGKEYVIMEAETAPVSCVEKTKKIKPVIASLASEMPETFDTKSRIILSQIRKQLKKGKPIRLIFVVTRKPTTSTLKSIKHEENVLIRPEVYYVNRFPPFEMSSNLLENIRV